jgi:hypothetical protein
MAGKLIFAAMLPFLVLIVVGHFIPAVMTVQSFVLLFGAEAMSVLVFFAAELNRRAAEDFISVKIAELVAILLAGAASILAIGIIIFCQAKTDNLFFQHFFPSALSTDFLFAIIAVALAGTSGLIAIMPLRGKWANIQHTTFFFLLSVLFLGFYVAAHTGLVLGVAIFWVTEVAIFARADKLTLKKVDKERDEVENKGRRTGPVNVEFRCLGQ